MLQAILKVRIAANIIKESRNSMIRKQGDWWRDGTRTRIPKTIFQPYKNLARLARLWISIACCQEVCASCANAIAATRVSSSGSAGTCDETFAGLDDVRSGLPAAGVKFARLLGTARTDVKGEL